MATSRREFLFESALSAAGIICGPVELGKQTETAAGPVSIPVQQPVRICFFSKYLSGLTYADMSAAIAEAGFDGIDLTVRNDGFVQPANVERDLPAAVQAARKAGIGIYMITTDIIDADDKFTEPILRTASSLGIQYYRMGPRPYDNTRSITQNLDSIKKKYEKLEKLNSRFQIRGECQNHSGDRFGSPVWDQWEVLRQFSPRWIGVQYDLLHATVEGSNSWPLGFRLLAPYIGTIDIKDAYWEKKDGKWDARFAPLGEGMADYPKFFELLVGYGMKGPFSIHCEYLSDQDDLSTKISKMKKDLTILKGWLTAAGIR